MNDRENSLMRLAVGDIFHAESANGASLICLVTSITDRTVKARTVTTQLCLEFDRNNGIAMWGGDSTLCRIDSVAALPKEIHEIMMSLDRKFAMQFNPEEHRLLDSEKHALLFVDSHYHSNPL